MDNISNNSSSSSWDLEMSMGANQFPFDRHSPLELLQQQQQQPPTLDPSSAVVLLPVPHLINSACTFPPPATAHMELGGGEENDEEEEEEGNGAEGEEEEEEEALGAMKEMMYRIAAMQPVDIDPATIKKPRRRNVRISDEPQSVAARLRRERISERIRILQRLVPGGTKMDTASMLDEAIRYVKFLKRQVQQLQANASHPPPPPSLSPAVQWSARPFLDARASSSSSTSSGIGFGFQEHHHHQMH